MEQILHMMNQAIPPGGAGAETWVGPERVGGTGLGLERLVAWGRAWNPGSKLHTWGCGLVPRDFVLPLAQALAGHTSSGLRELSLAGNPTG